MSFKDLRFSTAFCFAVIHGILIFVYPQEWEFSDFLVGIPTAFMTGAVFDFFILSVRNYKPLRLSIHLLSAATISLTALHIIYNEAQPSLLNISFATNKVFAVSIISDFIFWLYLLISLSLIVGFEILANFLPKKVHQYFQLMTVIFLTWAYILTQDCDGCDNRKWQRNSFLTHNIPIIFNLQKNQTSYTLDGRSLIKSITGRSVDKHEKANVILIMVEGLSDHHIKMGWLPEIEILTRNKGLYLNNFLTHQRQTNRGLFSAFCGAYPNLKARTAKADLMALSGLKQQCLPMALGSLGYHTVFLQSASLGYMSKDLFAEAVGFNEWLGKEDIDYPPALSSSWGVDDMTLYNEALNRISSYKKPYFLSLLTTSTHPPYNTPNGKNDKETAFRYASRSVATFIDQLDKSGRLDDTLVIITSDESSASKDHHPLAPNRGFFLAINNKIKPRKNSQLFGLVDIPKSILSFVGTNDKQFTGASIFADHQQQRMLLAGHSFDNKIYKIKDFENYIACSVNFECVQNPGHTSITTEEKFEIINLVNHSDIPKLTNTTIATISAKGYENSNSYTLLGRFITDEPVGQNYKLEIKLDNISPEDNALRITWITWDCTGQSPQTSHQTYTATPNSKNYSFLIFNQQHYKQQCHRVIASSSSPNITMAWYLHDLKLSLFNDSDFINIPKSRIDNTEIAHAGGRYESNDYSNSFQAINKSYGKGARLFEIDFNWTSDGQLVCIHDWNRSYADLFPNIKLKQVPSEALFEQHVENSMLTPCTLKTLLTWLDAHPDAYIVTDIKSENMNGLNLIMNLSGNQQPKFIPQIHDPINYFVAQQLGFSNVIWTLYRSRLSNEEVINISKQLPNLHAVTMPIARAEQGLAKQLQMPTYVHTINDPAERDKYLKRLGLTSIYTDTLIGIPGHN